MEAWTKVDMINFLAGKFSYDSYLEICTPTTGNLYAGIDRSIFRVCDRLMYRCSPDWEDGLAIDFRAETNDIGECVRVIKKLNRRYHIILVDPFHEYDVSYRDLQIGLDLLQPNGFLIVHDCLPDTVEITTPHFIEGSWCGVTYQAYIDFIMETAGINYATVDTDFGCGLIRKQNIARKFLSAFGAPKNFQFERSGVDKSTTDHQALFKKWKEASKSDYRAMFSFFEKNRTGLLNLITVDEFKNAAF